MIPDPGYWYFWPVTTMTVITLTAVHLYGRARSPDPWGVGTSLGLAAAGMLVLSLPFLALSRSVVEIGCTNTSYSLGFDPGLGVVAAALASSIFLWLLYLVAGTPAGRATLWVTITVLGTSLAVLIEFFFTSIALDYYCIEVGDFRLWHLLAAVVVAGFGGLVMAWRMQAGRR